MRTQASQPCEPYSDVRISFHVNASHSDVNILTVPTGGACMRDPVTLHLNPGVTVTTIYAHSSVDACVIFVVLPLHS